LYCCTSKASKLSTRCAAEALTLRESWEALSEAAAAKWDDELSKPKQLTASHTAAQTLLGGRAYFACFAGTAGQILTQKAL
jgi:hypothetical protein